MTELIREQQNAEKEAVLFRGLGLWDSLDRRKKREVIREMITAHTRDAWGELKGVRRFVWPALCTLTVDPEARKFSEEIFAPLMPALKARVASVSQEERSNYFELLASVARESRDFAWIVKETGRAEAPQSSYPLEIMLRSTNRDVVPFLWERARGMEPAEADRLLTALAAAPDLAKTLPSAQVLTFLSKKKSPETWRAAYQLLPLYPRDQVEEFLRGTLSRLLSGPTPSPSLKVVLDALARSGITAPELYPKLRTRILDPSFPERDRLVPAVGAVVGEAASQDLENLLHAGGGLAAAAAEGLIAIGRKNTHLLPALERALTQCPDTELASRVVLTRALGQLVGSPARKTLIPLVGKGGEPNAVRIEAAVQLAELGPSYPAAREVMSWLEHHKNIPRERLIEALPRLLGPAHLKDLNEIAPHLDASTGEMMNLARGMEGVRAGAVALLKEILTFEKEPTPLLGTLVSVSEDYRDTLPPDERQRYDSDIDLLITKALTKIPVTDRSACAALCKIWNDRKDSIQREGELKSVTSVFEFTDTFDAAVGALHGFFSQRAAPYCGQSALVPETSLLEFESRKRNRPDPASLAYLERYSAAALEKKLPGQSESRAYDDSLAASMRDLQGQIPDADLRRARDFIRRAHGESPLPRLLKHPATPYLKEFLILWHRETLRQDAFPPSLRKAMEAELKALESSLNEDLVRFRDRQVNGYGSGLITFAYGGAVTALQHPDPRALGEMEHVLAAANSPLELPYVMDLKSFPLDDWKPSLAPRNSPRGSAARALPFHLALYRHGSHPQIARENLLKAVVNFGHYFPQLVLQTLRPDTHAGKDGLAPYFFHPAVPYYTAALQLLLADPLIDPGIKKESLEPLVKTASSWLVNLTFLTRKPWSLPEIGYPFSQEYTSALLGLALLPLVKKCGDSLPPPSLGILVEPRPEGASLPRPSAKKRDMPHRR